MKKVLLGLLACLSLTACGYKDAMAYHVEVVEQPIKIDVEHKIQYAIIVCDLDTKNVTDRCKNCLEYLKLDSFLEDKNVISLTCTSGVKSVPYGTEHCHYCLVYTER